MATATPLLYKRYQSKDGTYPIVIRLINGKDQRYFNIKHKIEEEWWEGERVKKKHPDAELINGDLEHYLYKAKTYFSDCKRAGRPINLDFVFEEVKSYNFLDYLQRRVDQHREAGQVVMEDKVKRFIKELKDCFGETIYFSDITQDFLRRFENYLINIPNSANTRHKKYEFLGKYYQNAITEKMAEEPNPFYQYKIPTTPTKKEKLTEAQFQAVEKLPLKDGITRLARDMFLFAYYCKGIRFQTLLTMPKTAVQNGRLYYTINKGNKHMSAAIHPKLKAIIDRYIDNPTDTIFGRISLSELDTPRNKKSKIGSENANINRGLKAVAKLAGIKIELSMHHARHTFAFHLKKVSDNIHVIKDSLGHSRSQVTETYVQDLDDEYLDKQLSKLYKKK